MCERERKREKERVLVRVSALIIVCTHMCAQDAGSPILMGHVKVPKVGSAGIRTVLQQA
jgi:hypothetical protein